jgi:pyruvate dehydrogenase E1 component beta subunit
VSDDIVYWEARARALARCLDADPSIALLGETSTPFNPEDGLLERYPERFLPYPPISEFGLLGMSVAAAAAGLRPCVFVGTSAFMYYGWSPVVNEAPHIRYLSGGEVSAPVVVNIQAGARRAGGAQHEHTAHAMLQNVAGLNIYTPATPQSIYDVYRTALTGMDPAVIVDHVLLGETSGPLDEGQPVPVQPIEVLRAGDDGIVVATSLMSVRAREAAERLSAAGGPSVSVVNVTRITPSPWREIASLVDGREFAVFLDESRGPGSPASYLLARVAETAPGTRVRLVCSEDAPSPFSTALLDEVVPTVERIEESLRAVAAG